MMGKKTYLLSLVAVVWAVTGFAIGNLDAATAKEYVWVALTAMAMRAGVSK